MGKKTLFLGLKLVLSALILLKQHAVNALAHYRINALAFSPMHGAICANSLMEICGVNAVMVLASF